MIATGRILAFAFILSTLYGCAALDVTTWLAGDAKDALIPSAKQQQIAAVPAAPTGWIIDAKSGCATSNPQPTAGESIRWFGKCDDGKLSGHGTLVWNQNGHEVERNEGGFHGGEMHGAVVTTFDDSTYIVGKYIHGQRDGNFMIRRLDGSHLLVLYENGKLSAQRVANNVEVDAWLMARASRVANEVAAAQDETVGSEVAQVAAIAATTPSPVTRPPGLQSAKSSRQQAPVMPIPPAWRAKPRMPGLAAPGLQQTTEAVSATRSGPIARNASTMSPAQTIPRQFVAATFQPSPYPPGNLQPVAYYPGGASRLGSVTQTVRMYAGRDGPWVVDSRTGSAGVSGGNTTVIPSARIANRGALQGSYQVSSRSAPPQTYRLPQRIVAAAYRPRVMDGLNSVTRSAMMYAGRDNPWIVDSRTTGVQLRPQTMVTAMPVAIAATLTAPLEALGSTPPAAAARPAQANPAPRAASPDALFSEGYRFELAGQLQSATQLYDALLLQHPSAPSALLANARLVQLRRLQQQPVWQQQAQLAPANPPVAARRQLQLGQNAAVVAVNSPTFDGSLRPASLAPGQASASVALHRQVCSRDGLYESDSGWCGTVTSEQGPYYWVRVDGVHLRGFATIGITRSVCTGNNFLTWFSLGASVKVPKQCMTF